MENKKTISAEEICEELPSLMGEEAKEYSDVFYEDTSKRSENVKHFRMRNGQYMAAVYDKPVHSVNENNGKLEDIVQRFEETDEQYEAECNAYKAILPKKTGKRKFVTMERNGCSVSWRYIPRTGSHSKNPIAQIDRHERKVLTDLPVLPSAVYTNVDTGTSLAYQFSEDGIKENLVLAKRPKENRFQFELNTVGVRAVLAEDRGSVFFNREEEEHQETLMVIPPVQMTDGAGVFSSAAHYELTEDGNMTVLSVVVDPEWLYDDARIYPVTIDPQLLVHTNSDIPLSFVTIRSDGGKWSAINSNRVGFEKDGTENRMFAKYTIPSLPVGYHLVDATLTLHKSTNSGEDCGYNVYYVAKAWNNDTLTWANQPDLSGARIMGTIESDGNSEVQIDLTREVKRILNSNQNSIGFAIKARGSCVRDCTMKDSKCQKHICKNCEGYIDFYADLKNSSYSPRMIIRYTLGDEYADHQQSESFSVGRAGSGSVNLFTGKLLYSHLDILPDRDIMPLSLSHIYRSDYTSTTSSYGKGWTISAAQRIEKSSNNEVCATYWDAQGRKHYFKSLQEGVVINDTYCYADTAGVGLYYDGDSTIYDEKGNTLVFESGRLHKISDNKGHYNYIYYDDKNRVSRISNRNRSATLSYDSTGKLSYVMDKKNRRTSYVYNNSDDLIEIAYPDGNKTSYTYDSNHILKGITDCTGIQYTIEYSSGCVTKLIRKGTKENGRDSTTNVSDVNGGGLEFEYHAISTAVKDTVTGIKTVYRYDECGRVTSSYEDLSENTTLSKGEVTLTDLNEYEIAKDHKTAKETSGKYRSVKTGISGTADMNRNLLTNGSFRSDSDMTLRPSGWVMGRVTSCMDGVVNESYLSGLKSYRFDNSGRRTNKYLSQSVTLCGCADDKNVLVASAWAKASSPVNTSLTETTAKFQLSAKLYLSDGSSIEHTGLYDCDCTKWQYVAVPLEVEYGKIPVKAEVKFDFSGNTGTCLVSNIRLGWTRGTFTNIYYYENPHTETILGETQHIVRSVSTYDGLIQETTSYNDCSDAIRKRTYYMGESGYFDNLALYDNKHNTVKTQDFRGMVTECTYDTYGNVLTQKTYHKDSPDTYLYNRAAYNQTNGKIQYAYDSRDEDIRTTYQYDNDDATLSRRTDPNGQSYSYDYNSRRNTTSIAATEYSDDTCCDLVNGPVNKFAYDADYLTEVSHNGFTFRVSYDALGRTESISVGDQPLVRMDYTLGAESKANATYANRYNTEITSDGRGNPISKKIQRPESTSFDEVSSAVYDETGNVSKLLDKKRSVCYNYTYDANGNVVKTEERKIGDNSLISEQTYTYDKRGFALSKNDSRTNHRYLPIYEKHGSKIAVDGATLGIELSGKYTDCHELDSLRRVSKHTLTLAGASKPIIADEYKYLTSPDGHQTGYVSNLKTYNGDYTYTYDRMGNIDSVKVGTRPKTVYSYDLLGRLIQEDNRFEEYRQVWHYDEGGNITSKEVYPLTGDSVLDKDYTAGNIREKIEYKYDSKWKDQLISRTKTTYEYDSEGNPVPLNETENFTYDALGNPTTYKGNSLTWTDVRRLASYGSNTFAYGADGIRYKKNNITYTLDGSRILKESGNGRTITYYYGESGVIGFNYNGTDYFYIKNLQGDVTAIVNANGKYEAEYIYDAWGNCKVYAYGWQLENGPRSEIGEMNPFRYRSYYYDVETGLYYLETRYYDPDVGRFISADAVTNASTSLNSMNLFRYCNNNPPIVNKFSLSSPNHLYRFSSNSVYNKGSNSLGESSSISTSKSNINSCGSNSSFKFAAYQARFTETADIPGTISTGLFKIGAVTSITKTVGSDGVFYAFTDIKDASTGETTKSYGVGLNLYDVVGAELQVNDKIGIGVSANIFALNASVDVDLFGTSSVFIGLSSDASDDVSINNGFTIEVDTRFLGLVLIGIAGAYEFFSTGSTQTWTKGWELLTA